MLTSLLLWLAGLDQGVAPELRAFVKKEDPTYNWKRSRIAGFESLELVSQTWQGSKWRHDVVLVAPSSGPALKGAAIIEVTGWTPNNRDYEYAKLLADSSGMTVALLFQIPNQPLWGHEEDDLIAHTFERYFESGDPSWPLLFPMVKSVKAAMDALGESHSLEKFVVTGGSKRGWTTWLVGALGDNRVVGLAPAVFDNLDFPAQLARQKQYWNAYSPMIADYTERGLQDLLSTDRGKTLIRMVDPVHALPNIPTLVLTATNDAYWTVDSAQVYWDRLTMPKLSLAIPNAPHTMGDKKWWAPSLGQFARACATGSPLPRVESSIVSEGEEWRLSISAVPGPTKYRVWRATSADMHFDQKVWSVVEERDVPAAEGTRGIWVTGGVGKTINTAVLVELEFTTERGTMRLTTPVHIARKRG